MSQKCGMKFHDLKIWNCKMDNIETVTYFANICSRVCLAIQNHKEYLRSVALWRHCTWWVDLKELIEAPATAACRSTERVSRSVYGTNHRLTEDICLVLFPAWTYCANSCGENFFPVISIFSNLESSFGKCSLLSNVSDPLPWCKF